MTKVQVLSATQLPKGLLLMADPDWSMVQGYLNRAKFWGVIDDQQQVIAEIGVLLTRPWIAEIMTLAVAEQAQHQGLAQMLLRTVENWAREQQLKTLEIGTGNSSLCQLKIYQQAGFEIFAVEPGFFTRNYAQPIVENGLACTGLIRLRLNLGTN